MIYYHTLNQNKIKIEFIKEERTWNTKTQTNCIIKITNKRLQWCHTSLLSDVSTATHINGAQDISSKSIGTSWKPYVTLLRKFYHPTNTSLMLTRCTINLLRLLPQNATEPYTISELRLKEARYQSYKWRCTSCMCCCTPNDSITFGPILRK